MTPICFVDSETDGIHPDRLAWEIAMIRRDDTGEHATRFFIEIPLDKSDPFGLNVGKFYQRHPLGRFYANRGAAYPDQASLLGGEMLYESEAADRVAQWTHGAHLVGAVVSFDAHVFDGLLRRNHLLPQWHYHLIDVEALAVGFLAGRGFPVAPPWKSDDLTRMLGLEPPDEEHRHTALGDALWAKAIYDLIIDR